MKENILNKILIGCCLLAIVSCKARKQLAVNAPVAPTTTTPKHVNDNGIQLNPVREQQISFNSFSAKAHTKLAIDGNSNDVTLNIRINRDKEIWVSVTYLIGIEIARAKITPDSIEIINRLQSVYIKKPFNYIYAYANSQVNYTMLQALLVGNAIPAVLNDSTQYQAAHDSISLSGNLKDLIYNLVLGPDMRVMQTNLSNHDEGQSMQVVNSAFIQSGSYKLPSQIDIASIAKDRKIEVNLRYYKVDFNQPQEYPFNIPDDYSPAN